MLFNSPIFLVFALLFFLCWPLAAPHQRARWLYITLASFLFYGWWNWHYVFLLIATGLVDFVAALGMERHPAHKRHFLWLSIGSNLATLFVFKYLYFFTYNLQQLFHLAGSNLIGLPSDPIPVLSLVLPIGISFYTFQAMSYTIDVYRGDLKAVRDPLHFFASLAMFPHLVAGPIMRASVLLPQLETWERPNEQKRWDGLVLIITGYFKKMVLADNLAPAVNMAFNTNNHSNSILYWWTIMSMFALQIYFDFNGYSNIARGLVKWMGYEFSLNFDDPYSATSLKDFWSRWHISLSSWFRDYVYIPLGGSTNGSFKTQRNLWITMLLSGIWHGANWTYVAWGAWHAACLQFERLTRWPRWLASQSGGRVASHIFLLMQVWVGWVFFRAQSLSQALQILRSMFSFDGFGNRGLIGLNARDWLFFMIAILVQFLPGLEKRLAEKMQHEPVFVSLCAGLLFLASIFLRGTGNAFIYFNF